MNPGNIFWPIAQRAAPNGVQRLARVLHWTFIGLGLWCVVGTWGQGMEYLAGAAGLVMFGRALRYIMAGE